MRCFFVLLFSLMFVIPAWAVPQVTVETLEYDFGEVTQGDKVDYTFRFRNSGDELLVIDSVYSSCGCTAALLSSKQIAPGDMGEIKTTFDSSNFRNAIHKTITMETNDPAAAAVKFKIKGQVKEELMIDPPRVSFGKLAPGAQVEKLVLIKNSSKTIIVLDQPRATNPSIQASLNHTTLNPGDHVEMKIIAKVPDDAKRLSGYIMIDTDYANVPKLRLSVSASVSR